MVISPSKCEGDYSEKLLRGTTLRGRSHRVEEFGKALLKVIVAESSIGLENHRDMNSTTTDLLANQSTI